MRLGGPYHDAIEALAMHNGRLYVTGYTGMRGSDLDSLNGPTARPSHANGFVACFVETPTSANLLWQQDASGPAANFMSSVAVNETGIYVSGSFAGTTWQCGRFKLTSVGQLEPFVLKLTDEGLEPRLRWVVPLHGARKQAITGLAVRRNELFAVGLFDSPLLAVGGETLTNSSCPLTDKKGYADAFVLKFVDQDSTAALRWTQQLSGQYDEGFNAVAATDSAIYVAGYYSSAGARVPGVGRLVSRGFTDAVVAKLTETGDESHFVWAVPVGGTYDEVALALAAQGRALFVGGWYRSDDVVFGTRHIVRLRRNYNYAALFVAKLLDQGPYAQFEWARPQLGEGHYTQALAVHGSDVFAAGQFSRFGRFGLGMEQWRAGIVNGWFGWLHDQPRP